jgi:uncharacterized membrane protein YgdD (TMEM256/DUF423 family)
MRQTLDPWTLVLVSYALGIGGTAVMAGWSWLAMRAAEARRDKSRER